MDQNFNTQNKYSVVDDGEFNKIFSLVENNFFNGEKSIAFGSTHYKNSQEKCIALVCDYVNKKRPGLKILVISFEVKKGAFSAFYSNAIKVNEYLYNFLPNLTFGDWNIILKETSLPKELVDEYDLVFWDLPDLMTITDKHEELKSSFENMDSLYLISLKNSKFDDEHFKREIFQYYQDHGLDIRTILPWQFGTRRRRPRSRLTKWWFDLFRR